MTSVVLLGTKPIQIMALPCLLDSDAVVGKQTSNQRLKYEAVMCQENHLDSCGAEMTLIIESMSLLFLLKNQNCPDIE